MECRILSCGGPKGRHAKTRNSHHLAGFRVAPFRVFAPKTRVYDMAQISHHNSGNRKKKMYYTGVDVLVKLRSGSLKSCFYKLAICLLFMVAMTSSTIILSLKKV